jgi:phenylacetate-CoA ligase
MHPKIHKNLFYLPSLSARHQYISSYCQELDQTQWLSNSEIENLQYQKFLKLISDVLRFTPYYQKGLRGIDLTSIRDLADIEKLPFLEKGDLKSHSDALLCINGKRTFKKTTGGSTGNPVTVYQSSNAIAAADAAYWRGFGWAGIDMCDKQARFWGMPRNNKDIALTKVKDFILNRKRCSAFSFSEDDMLRYYHRLNKFRPKFIYGYVSMLEEFSKFLVKNNLSLKNSPVCVVTTSEVLTDYHRELIGNAFQCRVYNEYGCGETGTIAHECEFGSMHINAENVIVEIVKNNVVVDDGESGEIVVTDLNNFAMPLVRYKLKDIGYIDPTPCACGRGLPVLGGIKGRAYDTIYNRTGRAFHGEYFLYLFEDLQRLSVEVSGFQVIQNSYDNFSIKIIMHRSELKNVVESYILEKVQESFGADVVVKFLYVKGIDRETSGKIRLIKSAVSRAW